MDLSYRFNDRNKTSKAGGLTYYNVDAQTRNICFTPSDGSKHTLYYAHLYAVAFTAAEKAIILTFTTHMVIIKGHRLEALFESFTVHGPRQVTAVDERYVETVEGETESIVTHIDVRTR